MYDPTTGRWLMEDPIDFDAGDANLFRYVGNNPTNATDPSGLDDDLDYAKSEVRDPFLRCSPLAFELSAAFMRGARLVIGVKGVRG
jgi:uncharacterized protein RhaS with RHS repeats